MSDKSKISWTDATWNPVTGCTKISAGCANCYAERLAKRLQAMGQQNYRDGFNVRCHEDILGIPFRWKKPRRIFVCSMSDLFHEDVPSWFIRGVFNVMRYASQHRFQVLTKRAGRMAVTSRFLGWPSNVWAGVTVENQQAMNRIDSLRKVPASVRFLSCEPLLESLGPIDLDGIHWVIVGGESGPGTRPMKEEWAMEIKDQCVAAGIPFFFKQWGGVNKKKAGRMLAGQTWDQVPA